MTAPIQSWHCCVFHISANTSADLSDADGHDNYDCPDNKNGVDDDDEDDHNNDVCGDGDADNEGKSQRRCVFHLRCCAVISGDDALQMNKKELWLRVLPSTYLLLVFLAADSDLRLLKAFLL